MMFILFHFPFSCFEFLKQIQSHHKKPISMQCFIFCQGEEHTNYYNSFPGYVILSI